MKNIKTVPYIVAVATYFAAFASSAALAQDASAGRCREFNWKPGDIMRIETQMNKQTHVVLPEDALDVIWAPKELWTTDYVKNHIFINPTTTQPEGKETTITAVGSSGAAYEFRVVRVSDMVSHCVSVKSSSLFVNKGNWDTKDGALQQQVQVLQQQLAKANVERAQTASESQRQVQMAVKSYRSTIFSNYDWGTGSGWFASSGVESVQDDGRFTYIRLKSDSKGILSVLAEIDGNPEIIEKTYDASKREYRIAGIYPKFKLRAGDSEITVTRRGN